MDAKISREADGEGDSIPKVKFWPHKHRWVEFKEVEKLYKRLERECQQYRENIDKISKTQPRFILTDFDRRRLHSRWHRRVTREILAWKNDKLMAQLEALNNKQTTNNLQILMRHPIRKSLRSEKKILKEASISNTDGGERPGYSYDIAIRALEEPRIMIWEFNQLVRCYCWRGNSKTFMKEEFAQEIKDIMDEQNTWLVSYTSGFYFHRAPDEEQMKKLLQDTIRLMCIMKKVAEKIAIAVNEKMKNVENEKQKLLISLENKLADLQLEEAEVGKFLVNWKNCKISPRVYMLLKATANKKPHYL